MYFCQYVLHLDKFMMLPLISTFCKIKWAPSSEFVSLSIPSWHILTAHAQPFRGARKLAFCLKVPLDSLLVWASSRGSGETAQMRRLTWTFAARIADEYQIRLTQPKWVTMLPWDGKLRQIGFSKLMWWLCPRYNSQVWRRRVRCRYMEKIVDQFIIFFFSHFLCPLKGFFLFFDLGLMGPSRFISLILSW